jgi:hypothetical protein
MAGMSIEIDLHGRAGSSSDPTVTYDDADLPNAPGARYCYHVGSGGELIVLVEERGDSRVERVYSPTAWHCVTGDVWRKGSLLQG